MKTIKRTCVLVIAFAFILGCASTPEPEDHPVLTDREERIISSAISSLQLLADSSETAAGLLTFVLENAIRARYMDDGNLQIVDDASSDYYFIVYAYPDTMMWGAGEVSVAATFLQDNRTLGIYDAKFTPLVKGILFSHELQHAFDFVTGAEPLSDPFSPEWLFGEFNAHHAEYSVLNEWTHGRWKEAVLESRAARDSFLVAEDHRPTAFTMSPMVGDSIRITKLFGDLSYQDLSVLSTRLTFDANILNIQHYAESDSLRQGGIFEFLNAFYERFGVFE